MLIALSPAQTVLVLAAMRDVAAAGGRHALSAADRAALAGFHRFVLRATTPLAVDLLPSCSPSTLAAAVPQSADRAHVAQFLVVMALVDGTIDAARIAVVAAYARALDVDEDAVRQLAELGRGHLAWLRADVARQNLMSITGRELDVSIDAWILPYRGDGAQADLAARYHAMGTLPSGTLGRTFCEFYRVNHFAFPGEADSLNERFASPHDTTHLLSGYDISPQGELLVSTFTAGMHAQEPMSGHILPVILSWHVGIELAELAGATTGQLDPVKFWNAWERGAAVKVDVFADDWTLHAVAALPLQEVRATYGVPPLDPMYAASPEAPAWYKPVA